MNKKTNIKVGIILCIEIYIIGVIFSIFGFFDRNYSEMYDIFIYIIVFSPIVLALLFFIFYSFFYKWARIGLIFTIISIILYILKYLYPDLSIWTL